MKLIILSIFIVSNLFSAEPKTQNRENPNNYTNSHSLSRIGDYPYPTNPLDDRAKGYLLKNTSCEEIIKAIHMVMDDEIFLPKELKNQILSETIGIEKKQDFLPKITRREREVLELRKRLNKRGRDNKREIQIRLSLALSEISHHNDYKYVIINDKLNETISNIKNIIKYNQLKTNLLNKVNKNSLTKK